MAASITFDFISRGGPALAADFKRTGDNAAAAARGAKVLQDVISRLGSKENRTAAESANLARALRQTGDAEDRAAAKALAADIAIRRLADAEQDAAKNAGKARGGFAGLAGEVTGFGAASTAASSKSSLFAKGLAGINLASGVLEPALAGLVVTAGALGSGLVAAGAGLGVFGVVAAGALGGMKKQMEQISKLQAKLGTPGQTAAQQAAVTKQIAEAQKGFNEQYGTAATGIERLQKTWHKFLDSQQKPVLNIAGRGFNLAADQIPKMAQFLPPVEKALNHILDMLGAGFKSKGFNDFLAALAKASGPVTEHLGSALINIAAGIGGVIKAFLPMSQMMFAGLDKLTAKFRAWGQSLSGGTGFQSLMTTFREETPQAVAILKNLGVVLGNVGKAVFGLSSFSNSKLLLNMLLPLSGAMASLSKNTDLVRVALYALLAVKIGQQFSWVADAWKGLVRFAAAAEGATVAETIAAAATRAWGLAMDALPWVALAAAVVAVALLIIKYHTQIWNFMKRVWNDILGFIMGAWNWVKTHWPLLVAIITGPVGIAAVAVIKHWKAITDAARTAWNTIAAGFRWLVDKILGVFGAIIHGAASAFGWIPGLGSKLKGAAAAFDVFRANVNKSLGGINGRTVNVSVAMTSKSNPYPGGISGRAASGMFVSQGTGPTADDVLIRASRGELIVPANMVRAGAVDHLRGAIPGFAGGGVVVSAHTPSAASVESTLMGSVMTLAKAFGAAASAVTSVPVGNAGSGVMRWAPLVLQALKMEGLGSYLASQVLYQMQTESGGNPNAINLTDSNAAAGDPSRGLLQTIGSTFRAYHWPGTSWNIYDPLANIAAAINYARHRYGPTLMSGGMGMGSGHGYALGGLVPGYASGGTVAQQGAAYLKAWQTRHGGPYALAVGPKVLNQQIPEMAAAIGRAKTLAGAPGLSAGQHKFWASAAAGETRLLATLNKELITERAWRTMLGVNELGLDKEIRAAGSLPSLAGNVKGWKAQMGRDKATVAAISKMLGYSDAYIKAHPAAKPGPVLPTVTHTYGGDVANNLGTVLAAALGPFTGAARGGMVSYDRGGWLRPGATMAWNGTGRPEQVIPARGGGAGAATIELNITGGDQELVTLLRKIIKVKGGGDVQRALGAR